MDWAGKCGRCGMRATSEVDIKICFARHEIHDRYCRGEFGIKTEYLLMVRSERALNGSIGPRPWKKRAKVGYGI